MLRIVIVVILFVLGFWVYTYLDFAGVFDKKYSRDELTKNFIQNESYFEDVTLYFKEKLPKSEDYDITFELSMGNKVSLILFPTVIDPKNRIIGGSGLELGSPKLDSALTKLGWTSETVKVLQSKLARTNCDWIRTLGGVNANLIEISLNQSGWGSYTYVIFDMPITDSLVQRYGEPLRHSGFGERVTLNYSSAL